MITQINRNITCKHEITVFSWTWTAKCMYKCRIREAWDWRGKRWQSIWKHLIITIIVVTAIIIIIIIIICRLERQQNREICTQTSKKERGLYELTGCLWLTTAFVVHAVRAKSARYTDKYTQYKFTSIGIRWTDKYIWNSRLLMQRVC